jgi:hypothetical protein
MTDRVNGGIATKETLTGNMDFVTIHTVAAIAEGAYGSTNTATRNLIRLVETISLGAQPVLTSVKSEEVDLSDADIRAVYGLGTDYDQDDTTVYTLKFAVEHTGAVDDLATTLDGLAMPFTTAGVPITGPATRSITELDTDSATAKNTSVAKFDIL